MAKGKELDHLTQDALAAQAAGKSYGQYKGLQYEQVLQGKRPAPEIPDKNTGTRKICPHCGVQFTCACRQRKYCSDVCKERADGARRRARKAAAAQNDETAQYDDLPPVGGFHDY